MGSNGTTRWDFSFSIPGGRGRSRLPRLPSPSIAATHTHHADGSAIARRRARDTFRIYIVSRTHGGGALPRPGRSPPRVRRQRLARPHFPPYEMWRVHLASEHVRASRRPLGCGTGFRVSVVVSYIRGKRGAGGATSEATLMGGGCGGGVWPVPISPVTPEFSE
jgi:hypothetical protein